MINQFIVGGREIKNFLTFDKIYPNCKVYKLEQNYRSTKNILETKKDLYLITIVELEKNYGHRVTRVVVKLLL